MVMSAELCPSNFMRLGKVTPARSISVAYVCRNWCGTMRAVIPAAATNAQAGQTTGNGFTLAPIAVANGRSGKRQRKGAMLFR